MVPNLLVTCQFSLSWIEKFDVSNGLNKDIKKLSHQWTPTLTCQNNLKLKNK